MRKILSALLVLLSFTVTAQQKGNYALAGRFSPDKVSKMLFSTGVDPHWLKLSDRFWYVYETREGKFWYIVDAAKGTKQKLFDNAKLAAEITKIVKDPFDAQHLPIEKLKFIKDENSIQFQIKSTVDEIKKDTSKKAAGAPAAKPEKKVFYLNTISSAVY